MTDEQSALHLFGGDQEPLPFEGGVAEVNRRGTRPAGRSASPAQIPLMMPVTDEPAEWPLHPAASVTPVSENQLSFGPIQEPLVAAEPNPTQLTLLPEPPIWEATATVVEPKPKATRGRLARKRSRLGITKGQQPLF